MVKKGDTVGYGRCGVALNDINIATIPIGYADGLNRKLGNGKWKMLVNGKEAYTIGNICMDMCMIDVTHISCIEGDEVIVFNEFNTIHDFSNVSETIPYEVLTSISSRVKRSFFWN
jgi:alanine racemase